MKNNVSKSKITHLEKERRSLGYFHKFISSELAARIQEIDLRFTINHLLKTFQSFQKSQPNALIHQEGPDTIQKALFDLCAIS